jgi:protocatechuate 3,4-dioxygenase beta subunit
MLLFVPVGTDVAKARAIIGPLRRMRDEMTSARYRVFVVLVGAAPSPELLDAVGAPHDQWFVASLSDAELAAAERDFGASLSEAPVAYAFAQRRMLRQYGAAELIASTNAVVDDAGYAMRLLEWLHPEGVADDADHDTPQGALWFAPPRLHSSVKLAEAAAAPACFLDDAGEPVGNALVLLQSAEDSALRLRFARSDARGCLQLAALSGRYKLTLHALGKGPLRRELLRIETQDQPPVLGQCDGCEAAYDGRPLHLTSQARLGSKDEPGERMRLHGVVYGVDGKPAEGIQIYAHQTDQSGNYPPLAGVGVVASRHGRLRGWTVSDSEGRFRLDTVRPGGYPDSSLPQHIHLQVIEAGRCTYYLDDVEFADDPRRASQPDRAAPRGGSGLTQPARSADGVWEVRREIHLGRNLPEYERCAKPERQ